VSINKVHHYQVLQAVIRARLLTLNRKNKGLNMSSIGTHFPLRSLGIKRTPSMPPSPSPSEISLARPKSPDLVILLPEDNPMQQKLMTKQLEKAAKAKKKTIRIDFAKNFTDARNAIIRRAQTRGKKYDALLTDNQMQDTSGKLKENVGIDLIEWIKKHPKVEPTSRAMYSADNVREKVRLHNLVHRFFKKTESKEAAERVVGGAIAAKPLGTEIQTASDVQSPKSKRSMESLTALFGQPSAGSRISLNRSNTGGVASSSMHSGFDTSPLPSPSFTRQVSGGLSQNIPE
jgi:CheY-like chemotaxis protein